MAVDSFLKLGTRGSPLALAQARMASTALEVAHHWLDGRVLIVPITTSGDRAKAQPMIDSVVLCAQFLSMAWGGVLWGKGGPPGAVQADVEAVAQARTFLADAVSASAAERALR